MFRINSVEVIDVVVLSENSDVVELRSHCNSSRKRVGSFFPTRLPAPPPDAFREAVLKNRPPAPPDAFREAAALLPKGIAVSSTGSLHRRKDLRLTQRDVYFPDVAKDNLEKVKAEILDRTGHM